MATVDRKHLRRTKISSKEKGIGFIILVLLVAIAVFIQKKGETFDPSLYAIDNAALESSMNRPAPSHEEVSPAPVSHEDAGGYDSHSQENGNVLAQTERKKAILEDLSAFPDFQSLGDSEYYNPDTLYEKINGRAPAYLGFNFQALECRSFSIDAAPEQFIDVFIFSMDTPVNAFGIFSMEREAGATPVDFVKQGYRSEMGFFYRQGNAYVQVIASDISEVVLRAAEEFSKSVARLLDADDTGVEAASILPTDRMVAGSLSYIQENAYGLALFNNVFEAHYEVDDQEFSFFAMMSDAADAREAYESARQFFQDYGTVSDEAPIKGSSFFVGESFGLYSVIYLNGDELGGVMNADDLPTARAFVEAKLNQSQP
jgi:hypothetical protein